MHQTDKTVTPIPRFKLLRMALLLEGGMLAVGWIWANGIGYDFVAQLNISWTTTAIGLLGTVPMLGLLYVLGRSEWEPMARLRTLTLRLVQPIFKNSTVTDIAIVSILAGLGEEALFRAAFQPWLGSFTFISLPLAIIIASVIFGLVHYLSFAYFVYATIIGVYLSVLLVVTDSLWVPIVVHAVYDFIGIYYIAKIHKAPEVEPASESP